MVVGLLSLQAAEVGNEVNDSVQPLSELKTAVAALCRVATNDPLLDWGGMTNV